MVKKLFLAGLFLVILGIGNIIVGQMKGSQYDSVAEELALISKTSDLNPTIFPSNNYPLLQIENSRHTSEHLLQRKQKALMRRDLYRVVVFGGKAMVSLGLLMIVFSALLTGILRHATSSAQTLPTLIKNDY